jgi:hypothetical protein
MSIDYRISAVLAIISLCAGLIIFSSILDAAAPAARVWKNECYHNIDQLVMVLNKLPAKDAVDSKLYTNTPLMYCVVFPR